MKNTTIRFCQYCGTKPVAVQHDPRSLYCGAECVHLGTKGSDDGYDAWRDNQMDTYNRKDYRYGSWDR